MKHFDAWNEVKKALDGSAHWPYFKEGEIWFSSIGLNVGDEEDGENAKFERPVLILRRFNRRIFIGVSLSSIAKPDNKYYLSTKFKDKKVSIIVSQVRPFSVKRLRRRMGTLSFEQLHEVSQAVNDRISPLTVGNKKRTLANQGPRGPKAFVPSTVAEDTKLVNRENSISAEVNRQIWSRMTILEQMGSIYPAIEQCLQARREQNDLLFAQSLDRAIAMFDATVETLINQAPHRIRELLTAQNEFLRLFYIDHPVEEEASLLRYFQYFANAGNNAEMRQFA